MARKRQSPEKIAAILRRAEIRRSDRAARAPSRRSRKHATPLEEKYGQLGTTEIREINELRDENTRLKRLVADLTLDKVMLQDVLSKKALKPAKQRALVGDIRERYGASQRRVCTTFRFNRKSVQYRPKRNPMNEALLARIKELAMARIRYGQRRIWVLLRREGWAESAFRVCTAKRA